MKQILQNMQNGETFFADAPDPLASENDLVIATLCSLISVGTERMLVDFGKSSYLSKAKQHPDKVKMVLDKVTTDGLLTTIDAVRSKLAQPIPLGYCNVGIVTECGGRVTDFRKGDRVVSNGSHADVVKVSKNLCALVPDSVDDETASFTVLASIGLQGVRLANPTLGESFVVIGAGLIGLLTIQLLKANGCRVLALDYDESKLKIAREFGAKTLNLGETPDPVDASITFSRGIGIDGVIITASTDSNEPISQAARMSRKRGRIILVGVTGLNFNRAEFYEKELSFQVSCSYGPGRYDKSYEEQGNDYPIGFVRWTEQRNFEAVLELMASGHIDVKPLISHRFEFDDAIAAYEILSNDKTALGILLKYDEARAGLPAIKKVSLHNQAPIKKGSGSEEATIGFIGAGNYASRVLIPAFQKTQACLHTISSHGGLSSAVEGKKAGFKYANSDCYSVIDGDETNTIVIATRHDSHAELINRSLKAGKHVFVEKPLAITIEELVSLEDEIVRLSTDNMPILMIGFNRRFAPHIQQMKNLLTKSSDPMIINVTVNAGHIPQDHWTQNMKIGGGRIIGEACHFIDLCRFLTGKSIISVAAEYMASSQSGHECFDNVSILLKFEDGSMATILYLANGAKNYPKERVEVFHSGKVLVLDNFVRLKGYGWNGFNKLNLWKQDKGQEQCVKAFMEAVQTKQASPIGVEEMVEVTRATFRVMDLLNQKVN